MESVLTMGFSIEKDGKTTIRINGVKSKFTDAEANALMDTIIAKNVFLTPTGACIKG